MKTLIDERRFRAMRSNVAARSAIGSAWWLGSALALAASIAMLFALFWFVLVRGVPALRPEIFVTVTNGISGGLANAIVGTFMLVLGGLVLVMIVGVGSGIWLTAFAGPRMVEVTRFLTDVLSGVPSIVVGYFGYVVLLGYLGWGFSLAAGAIALAIIMLPYVVRGTDLALSAVPQELREGALALGSSTSRSMFMVCLPSAMPGILTSVLLAVSIALGETAPLIYTAGWSNYMPSAAPFHSPVGYLTYVVWTFINQPFAQSHALAYAAAVILMAVIFLTNVVARTVVDVAAQRLRG
ncbi:MAG TPA: phosphate ABC transporter permease PstA [Candidatus Dormibacteraeota bacterium]|nr:phosphate ABC transporter permease PstA [Candidatus Dormibacteraeota bacterium]